MVVLCSFTFCYIVVGVGARAAVSVAVAQLGDRCQRASQGGGKCIMREKRESILGVESLGGCSSNPRRNHEQLWAPQLGLPAAIEGCQTYWRHGERLLRNVD